MEFLLKMTEQLSETEKELEQALKEKQSIIQISTKEATTGTTAADQQTDPSQVNTSSLSSDELAKQIESLKLRVT